jgi:hypothetical protein
MNIIFPKSKAFFSDLILQRTEGFIKCGGGEVLSKWMEGKSKDHLVDYLISNNKYEDFMKWTMNTYIKEVDEFIKIFNIEKINNLISIGPGNGIFEILLSQKIKFKKILLIDIERTESQNHGFNEKGSGYANLIDTKNFLITNDIPSNKIITCNPEKHKIPKFKFDLLISLFSMGFHYPCNEYTDFILKNASHRSKIIYDKRRNVFDKGHETLQQKLKFFKKIPRIKHDRILMEMV